MLNFSKLSQSVKKKENLIKAGVFIASIAVSFLIFIYRNQFKSLGRLEYLGIFLLSIIGNSTIIIPAPSFITAFVGGSILNPYAVGFISALGASIGELTGYLAGFGGKVFVKEEKTYKKVEFFMKKNGFLTIFVLAAIPNPFFDLAGISAGLTNYPLRNFMAATILGKSIKFIFVALLGMKAARINL